MENEEEELLDRDGKIDLRTQKWRQCCNGLMEEVNLIHNGFIVPGWKCQHCNREVIDPVKFENLLANYIKI